MGKMKGEFTKFRLISFGKMKGEKGISFRNVGKRISKLLGVQAFCPN